MAESLQNCRMMPGLRPRKTTTNHRQVIQVNDRRQLRAQSPKKILYVQGTETGLNLPSPMSLDREREARVVICQKEA